MKSKLIATLLCAAAGTAFGQTSGNDACALPAMRAIDAQLYQKAGEGPTVLRQYMTIRRNILQRDLTETLQWAERVDQARMSCLSRLASQGGTEAAPEQIAHAAPR